MKRPSQAGRPRAQKHLAIESLEKRQLLAADCVPCPEDMTPESMNPVEIPQPVEEAESQQSSQSDAQTSLDFIPLGEVDETAEATDEESLLNFNANADAGSTRSSALDLGVITSQQSIDGNLSYFDRMDVFRFEITNDSVVTLGLSEMWGNADLILADANGRGIATSRNSGTTSEAIESELSAGIYYVAVQSRSFWGTSYQLDLAAESVTPPSEVGPGEGGSGEGENGGTGGGNTDALPDVPYFGSQRDWNLNSVNAPEAWAAGYTGQGITVAVVDTGVDLDHPDLATNLYVNPGEIPGNGIDDDQNGYVDDVNGYDFAYGDSNADDLNGHGTHVAGTIAALNNGSGATGVAHDATILPVKVLRDNGSGSNSSVAAGIRYAADLGAEVINLSLGGGYSQAVHAAINYASSLGSIVIAAAGNESAGAPSFPARLGSALTNVISVGAHNSTERIAGFSNDVGSSNTVQIDAPGVGVYSTYAGGRYGSLSGTSMASPHVAGVAALALSANPNLTPAELRSLLVDGVTRQASGSDAIGIVNAATTVAYAAAGFSGASANSSGGSFSQFGGNSNSTRAISVDAAAPVRVSSDNSDAQEDSKQLAVPTILAPPDPTAVSLIAHDSAAFSNPEATTTRDRIFAEEAQDDSTADSPSVTTLAEWFTED